MIRSAIYGNKSAANTNDYIYNANIFFCRLQYRTLLYMYFYKCFYISTTIICNCIRIKSIFKHSIIYAYAIFIPIALDIIYR